MTKTALQILEEARAAVAEATNDEHFGHWDDPTYALEEIERILSQLPTDYVKSEA